MKQFKLLAILGLTSWALASCTPEGGQKNDVWIPIYMDAAAAKIISSKSPREVINGGKIYLHFDNLYQVESGKGIHVFKIIDQVPQPYRFYEIIGAQEISIRGNTLYTNNGNDLVGIDISNPESISEKSRTPDAFNLGAQELPPSPGFFQCIDESKGLVVGWEQVVSAEADCRY